MHKRVPACNCPQYPCPTFTTLGTSKNLNKLWICKERLETTRRVGHRKSNHLPYFHLKKTQTMHQSTPPPPSLQVTSTSFGAMQMPDRPCGAGVDPATDWGAQRKFCERRSGIHLVNLMRSFSWGQLGAGDKFRGFEGNYCEGICRQHLQEPTFFVSVCKTTLIR